MSRSRITKPADPTDWHGGLISGDRCPLCRIPAAYLVVKGRMHRQARAGDPDGAMWIVKARRNSIRALDAKGLPIGDKLLPIGEKLRPSDAPRKVVEDIRQVAALLAAGKTHAEIIAELELLPNTIPEWQMRYRPLWEAEVAHAMNTAAAIIRQLAGTDAILEDPSAYYRQAAAAERWCRRAGVPLFKVSEAPTLTSFFRDYYEPMRLSDVCSGTMKVYQESLRKWTLFTGDPPLATITPLVLARFRDYLQRMKGKDRVSRYSATSVRKILAHIQWVLDKAGPPGPRNRDAADLIATVPWIRLPRLELKEPRIVSDEQLSAVYLATACMDRPRLPGIRPPAWWKAILVFLFNTGLRRGTVFRLHMNAVDWANATLTVPADSIKSRRTHVLPLNTSVIDHLRAIRTNRELLFPWPHGLLAPFYREWHRLLSAAGIPRADHFGFHDIRRTLATRLWVESPAAAQLVLGHVAVSTTIRHYVNGRNIVADALGSLAQPAAFRQPTNQGLGSGT